MEWTGRFVSKPGSVCPGFDRLRYLAACPHGCAYCYLQGAYWRGRPRDITEADLPEMERAVERWLADRCPRCRGPMAQGVYTISRAAYRNCIRCGQPAKAALFPRRLLNAGELSDSFAPEICAWASLRLIELFRRQNRHALLLLSKARPTALLDVEPTPQVIVSFSLGQQTYLGSAVAPGTPDSASVLESAVRLHQAGWRVRLRIDPLIDETGVWEIITALEPVRTRWERVTLGTLRFTRSGYRAVAHGSPSQAALAARVAREDGEAGTHPYRIPLAQRAALYGAALEVLQGRADDFALCKETEVCWRAVSGSVPGEVRCNCTP